MKLKQIYLSFYFINLIIVIVLGGLGYWTIDKISSSLQKVMLESYMQRAGADADMMHDAIRADVLSVILASQNADYSTLNTASEDIQKHSKRYLDNMSLIQQLDTSAAQQQQLTKIKPKIDAYILAAKEIASFVKNNQANLIKSAVDASGARKIKLNAAKTSNLASFTKIKNRLPQFLTLFSELDVAMGEISNYAQMSNLSTKEIADNASQLGKISKNTLLIGTLLVVILLILLGLLVNKRIKLVLGNEPELVQELTNTFASGDLSKTIILKPGDRTSFLASVFTMQSNLRHLIAQIQVSAESINNGAARDCGW